MSGWNWGRGLLRVWIVFSIIWTSGLYSAAVWLMMRHADYCVFGNPFNVFDDLCVNLNRLVAFEVGVAGIVPLALMLAGGCLRWVGRGFSNL